MSVYKVGKVYHFDFWYDGKRYKGSTRQVKKGQALQYEAKQREEARNEALAPKVRDVGRGEPRFRLRCMQRWLGGPESTGCGTSSSSDVLLMGSPSNAGGVL